jgi:ribonuclease P/MRP protein subunit POP8
MAQFLGHMGAAVPIDILRVDEADNDVWIRVPADDGRAVVAALGQFVGSASYSSAPSSYKGGSAAGGAAGGGGDAEAVAWKVKGWDDWLGRLVLGGKEGGADLFGD